MNIVMKNVKSTFMSAVKFFVRTFITEKPHQRAIIEARQSYRIIDS